MTDEGSKNEGNDVHDESPHHEEELTEAQESVKNSKESDTDDGQERNTEAEDTELYEEEIQASDVR